MWLPNFKYWAMIQTKWNVFEDGMTKQHHRYKSPTDGGGLCFFCWWISWVLQESSICFCKERRYEKELSVPVYYFEVVAKCPLQRCYILGNFILVYFVNVDFLWGLICLGLGFLVCVKREWVWRTGRGLFIFLFCHKKKSFPLLSCGWTTSYQRLGEVEADDPWHAPLVQTNQKYFFIYVF